MTTQHVFTLIPNHLCYRGGGGGGGNKTTKGFRRDNLDITGSAVNMANPFKLSGTRLFI